MTTTSQQTVLDPRELALLREFAEGRTVGRDGPLLASLAAKGMLEVHEGHPTLTPAGQHALRPGEPGTVPGLDN